MIRIIQGDCVEQMREMEAESVDSAVTDPPYHLTSIVKRFGTPDAAPAKPGRTGAYARASAGFMGKKWDGGDIAMRPETWAEVLRVLKPGGHLIALCGTRTEHRVACAIEDAGFEIRDRILWLYGSGFPKSHNLDGDWQGWGTALKPAVEIGVLARKPLAESSIARNVLAHGTGAINVDGCRIASKESTVRTNNVSMGSARSGIYQRGGAFTGGSTEGRWPANVCHDGSDEVLAAFAAFGEDKGQSGAVTGNEPSSPFANVYGDMPARAGSAMPRDGLGTPARFFYSGKAGADDRLGSKHPTIKPVALMRWLVRMVTPPGGTVLDPFAGSGTTGMACLREGFDYILIEQEAEYIADIKRRIAHVEGGDTPLFAEVTP